jgi:polyketide cyclase/dehydrase/lipid transport protein
MGAEYIVLCNGYRSCLAPLIVIALAGSCRAREADSVAVAKAFIREARTEGCGRAYEYFTPEVQENARQASHRARRNQPYLTDHTLPERIFCSGYDDMVPRSVRLMAVRGDTAYLSVTSATGTHFPIIPFLSDPYKETRTTLTLVKLPVGWRVTRPLLQVLDPRRPEFEYGPITVAAPTGGNPDVRLFQVTGPVVAPPEDVEAVLLDYEAWPRWIPYLVESRVLTADSGRRADVLYGRYQLTPGGRSADYVMRAHISLRVNDRDFRGFGGGWHTRAGSTPVPPPRGVSSPSLTAWGYTLQFRLARWVTRPGVHMVDTVNVSLDYAGKTAEWPPELAEKVIAPEFGARMLQGLEREAKARASARGP